MGDGELKNAIDIGESEQIKEEEHEQAGQKNYRDGSAGE